MATTLIWTYFHFQALTEERTRRKGVSQRIIVHLNVFYSTLVISLSQTIHFPQVWTLSHFESVRKNPFSNVPLFHSPVQAPTLWKPFLRISITSLHLTSNANMAVHWYCLTMRKLALLYECFRYLCLGSLLCILTIML